MKLIETYLFTLDFVNFQEWTGENSNHKHSTFKLEVKLFPIYISNRTFDTELVKSVHSEAQWFQQICNVLLFSKAHSTLTDSDGYSLINISHSFKTWFCIKET